MVIRDAQFELLTPRGAGGVAVVRVSGSARIDAVAGLVGEAAATASTPRLAVLRRGGEGLDSVLVVARPASACIELHLHGSAVVVTALEKLVGGFVAAPLQRGEALLRGAQGQAQLALALEQVELPWAAGLAAAVAAGPDALAELARRSAPALALATPQRLVLCGEQNAGKSTLMNRLLFRERVLTGDLPGLTRDAVAAEVLLGGYPYLLIDTAGEGDVAAELDRLALARARAARSHGLRLLVVAGDRLPSASDREIRNEHTLVVRSKADQPAQAWPEDFAADVTVAGLEASSAARIRAAVGGCLAAFRALPEPGPAGGLAALDGAEWQQLQAAIEESREASH